MKQRVLSVALALCICLSSHSVAYASQEVPPKQEDALPSQMPDGMDTSGDVTASPQETPSRQEDVLPSQTPDGADISEDAAASPMETPSLPEDVLPSQTPDGMDISGDVSPSPQKTPLQQEDVLPTQTPDVPGTSEDVSPSPQRTPSQQESVLPTQTPAQSGPTASVTPSPEQTPTPSPQENVLPTQTPRSSPAPARISRASNYPGTWPDEPDITNLAPAEIYGRMTALKDDDRYKEGTYWTNDEPYSDSKGYYRWRGGTINGKNIVAVGCVAFAFTLSDAAFGGLPARIYATGQFTFEDIKTGDILQVNGDAHTVIVLEVHDTGVIVAEGNIGTGDHQGKIHWGRAMSKEDVMGSTSHYITRYPENYIPPNDPEANESIGNGTLDGGLAWNLTKAGTLTVSGQGAMPDFASTAEQPWKDKNSQIRKVVIKDGVTSIGSCAFWECGVTGVEIPSSVTAIGNSAFSSSSIISVTIPSSVKTIGDSAFYKCQNLGSVTIREGVETIGQNAFNACTSLTSIALPASIKEVGAAAFFQCQKLTSAVFAPGSNQVKLGDNIFTQCYYLMNVTLPRNIDRIGEGMFQNCMMLAGVEIPQGAESIGGSAFASSGLSTVIIPDSVKQIGIAAFSNCPLKDIYFTGTETQWNSIGKIGDTAQAVLKATIHYNYIPPVPSPSPTPGPDDGDDNDNTPGDDNDNNTGDDNDNNTGDNDNNTGGDDNDNNTGDNDNNTGGGDDSDNNTGDDNNGSPDNGGNNPGGSNPGGNKPGSGSGDNAGNHTGSGSNTVMGSPKTSSIINSGLKAVVDTWKPTTPEDKKRYACVGEETVQYTTSNDNAYPVTIKNAVQGPMCFKSFEAVLGDYTIGRTYNIYSLSENTYSMDKEIEITIQIPPAIYKENRDYKMICVTKGGQPVVFNDIDNDPQTITIKTNKFYAYALIYK